MREVATAVITDVISKLGIPTNLLNVYHRRKIEEASEELRYQLLKGEIELTEACRNDAHLDSLYSYFLAAVSGVARENIKILSRLLRESIVGDNVYPDDFSRLKTLISALSYDELHVVAAVYQFDQSKTRKTTNHVVVGGGAQQLGIDTLPRERVEQVLHSLIGKGLLSMSVSTAFGGPTIVHARPTADLILIARLAEQLDHA